MHLIRQFPPLSPDDTIQAAANQIATHGCGMPVADAAGQLIGFLDEADLLGSITPGYLRDLGGTDMFVDDLSALERKVAHAVTDTVGEHMCADPAFIDSDDSEMNATARFLQSGQHTLPAIDAQTREVIGVLRLPELIRDVMEKAKPH